MAFDDDTPDLHPVVIESAKLILAGDVTAAEKMLEEVADEHGDLALVELLDQVAPKDLLAVIREFDSSRESVVNLLVTPEQFAHAIVLERQYGERTAERLRAMVNNVIHRDEDTVGEYIEALVEHEQGLITLADYFEDRYEEMLSFATSGRFVAEYDHEAGANVHRAWLVEKLEELDETLGFGNYIEENKPAMVRAECSDGDWMETAWVMRDEQPDAFEELMGMLRDRMARSLEALNAALLADLLAAEGGDEPGKPAPSADEEESAI